jgi:hypothetical protein
VDDGEEEGVDGDDEDEVCEEGGADEGEVVAEVAEDGAETAASPVSPQHPSLTPAAVGQQRPSRWRAAQAELAAQDEDEDGGEEDKGEDEDDGADALKNGTEDIFLAAIVDL